MGDNTTESYWLANWRTPRLNSWRGYAFELTCLLHERQLMRALGITALSSAASSWRSEESNPGAQVDLVLDRNDGIIDLCELKWSVAEYAITKAYDVNLRNKLQAFTVESAPRKAARLVLVTPYGLKPNAYSDGIQEVKALDALFA